MSEGLRFSGRNFDITIFDETVHVQNASVTINDETAVSYTRGVTDGYTEGKASCDVELEIGLNQFKHIQAAAKSAGSYRGIDPTDIMFYAHNGDNEDKIVCHGVKFVLSDLLSVDPESADKTTRKIKGFVTSPLFVTVNGVSVLSENDTRGLINA
ncbi:phage protein [Vibrio quintilis]|uniref:Phage tail tube protein FII n=1 Tax=Vibrio quintilis TaxID=1117707 RepID=A0A1M7YYX7_9VIBR|nr:phage protein [Vibrio quintilis]SHO57889.1 hypothetical protein VQ7734_03659 [Vibrio quintilis]